MEMQMGSFQHQKSPKVSGQGTMKSMKIGGAPGTHGSSASDSYSNGHVLGSGQGYGSQGSKNVRIVLVGNGNKNSTYKNTGDSSSS